MYGDSGVVFGALASTCRYALADLGTQLFLAQLVAHPGEHKTATAAGSMAIAGCTGAYPVSFWLLYDAVSSRVITGIAIDHFSTAIFAEYHV